MRSSVYKQNRAFSSVPRMDPAHKKHLQRLWLKLLENITHYQGIVDGLFAEGILTGPLKQRVVSIMALYLSYFWNYEAKLVSSSSTLLFVIGSA